MLASDLNIVRATDRELPDVLSLLAEYLPGSNVGARHQWLYKSNPHGRALTLIAYDSTTGAPAGLTSVFPRKVMVSGREHVGSIGGDGYVSPRFRKRGIATRLHDAMADAMRAAGIDFLFGPPEPTNLRALVRAGSNVVTEVARFARPHPLQWLARELRRFGSHASVRLEPLDDRNSRAASCVTEVWERAYSEQLILPVRDASYYAWRFGKTPSGAQRGFAMMDGNRTMAVCALEQRENALAIVDLVADAKEWHRAITLIADLSGARHAAIQVNVRSAVSKHLWHSGFISREKKAFQVLCATGADHVKDAVSKGHHWYYTWGDGDVDQLL